MILMDKSLLFFTSLHAEATPTVADPDGVTPLPSPVFKYPMKMKYFFSVRPNYFIFIGYLRNIR